MAAFTKNPAEMKTLVSTIINWHETQDFESLSSRVSDKEIAAATWFTRQRFEEVCAEIDKQIGRIVSLEFIDSLNRKTSFLTLWKATYSKTRDEVLWQITFETQTGKILLMYINWEHS